MDVHQWFFAPRLRHSSKNLVKIVDIRVDLTMISRKVKVVNVTSRFVEVRMMEFQPSGLCTGCIAEGCCGAVSDSGCAWHGRKDFPAQADDSRIRRVLVDAKRVDGIFSPGDEVALIIEPPSRLKVAMLRVGLPFTSFLAAVIISVVVGCSPDMATAVGITAAAAACIVGRFVPLRPVYSLRACGL